MFQGAKGLSNATAPLTHATARKDPPMVAGTSKRKYGSDCWSTSAYIPTARHDPDARVVLEAHRGRQDAIAAYRRPFDEMKEHSDRQA